MTDKTVIFHTLKKHYTVGETVAPSITVTGFVPSADDWIGIFDSLDTTNGNAVYWKYIPTPNNSEQDTKHIFSLSLDVSFAHDHEVCYELRYVSKSISYGKSTTFQISAIARQESFITIKEGVSSDDDLILIDKFSVGGMKKVEDDVVKLSKDLHENQINLKLLKEEHVCTVTDKDILNNLLEEETLRRQRAETSVEELSRKLVEQMKFIENQSEEVVSLRLTCDREKTIKDSLKEDCEMHEEIAIELEDVKVIAQNYKNEFSKVNVELHENEKKLERMNIRYFEDRELFSEEINQLKETATDEIEKLENKNEILEASLKEEKFLSIKLKEDFKTKKESYEVEINILKDTIVSNDILLQKVKTELQVVIDDQQKELANNKETITEFESRVCNESNNASRLENDLTIAENRVKEATDDIKYFRQKFLDAEQVIQQKQTLLSKYLEELNNIKNLRKNEQIFDADKSDVSACNSNEALPESRLRTPGDVTDFTDDEGDNTRSVEAIIRPAYSTKPTHNVMSIDPETLQRTVNLSTATYTQPISVIDGSKSRRYGKPIDLNVVAANAAKTATYSSFPKDVSQLDRNALEKQHDVIRQHRNSLLRENAFLKNKVSTLNRDIIVMNRNLQDSMAGMITPPIFPPASMEGVISNNQNNGGALSPYAIEYKPQQGNNQPILPTPMFMPPIGLPLPPAGFFEFMAAQCGDLGGFPITLPPTSLPPTQLPPTPLPHAQLTDALVDVSEQLSCMGINISKSL